jgi:HAE1 family hydrophobic/amphiphilic exporter-1
MQTPNVNPLVRFAVERRVSMGMALLAVLVLGWISLSRLPLEFLPTLSSSNVSVSISYPSASPEEIARRIVQPLEDSLGTLNALDRLSSQATADSARFDLAFIDGTDMDMATVEVRDRVDRVRHLLPGDLRRVTIRRFQTSDIPVLRFHASSSWDRDRLYTFAEQVLQKRLQRLPGVAQVQVRGLRTREVQVRLSPDSLAAHGLEVRQVSTLLRQNHLNVSAGHIDERGRKLRVRVLGELTGLRDIENLPLPVAGLRLADVAEVAYAYPEQEEFNFLNGQESLSIRVYKASNANLLEVVDLAKVELAAIGAEAKSAGLETRIYSDASVDVRKGLAQLREAGFLGGGLAVLAVFLFLRRVRTTLLVAIAIPVSVVFTFVLIYLLRQAGWSTITINVVSLMGLVLALGMLMDNSIVVIEAIYRRLQVLGEDAKSAAIHGASEVALPIFASTMTTLCVFVPMIFLGSGGGFFARFLIEIGTSVCIVMVASLVVALTVVPMAAAILLGKESPRPSPWVDALGRRYQQVLALTLRAWPVLLLVACGLLYGSWHLFGTIQRTFASRTLGRQVTINVDTPRSYTLLQTASLFDDLVQLLDGQRETLDIADISYEYRVGGGRSRGGHGQTGRKLEIYLADEEESQLSTVEVRDRIRALLPVWAGVDLRIDQARGRHGSSSGVEVELSGDDLSVLELLGREVAARMAEVPGVQDVDTSLESGDDEVLVAIDSQRAVEAGLSSEGIAQAIASSLSSRALTYLKTAEREVDLVVQFSEEERETLAQLRNLAVGAGPAARPLDTLAEFSVVPGPRSIARENRRSKITLTANSPDPMAAGMAIGGVRRALAGVVMPPGYAWSFGRWTRMGQKEEEGANFALIFAFLLVYMLLAALFESFSQPFSIMFAVPFAFIGVGAVMKLAGQPRDNYTELGFIILVGVVVNNAIVLVDHINRLRAEGLGKRQAILDGGRDRLRAILMTAVTTILGLLPMVGPFLWPAVFGSLEGRAATWAPLGLVILGGLTTSTFLTLLILPTLYSLSESAASFLRRVVRAV